MLLELHTHMDVVINRRELPCLSEKSNSHRSLSTSPKALGVLFYESGSGNLMHFFFGDCLFRRLHTNTDKEGVLE